MKKTISFFCIASLIIIGCHPEPSLAQAQGVVRTGVGKIFGGLRRKVGNKAAGLIDNTIIPPHKLIKKPNRSDNLLELKKKFWYSNCKNAARSQVITLAGRSNISQEELIQLTEKSVIETISMCIEGPQTLKSVIKDLTLELVREILSEQHNFQLTSFNRQEKD
jgi:hypothetical protein